jgi:exodeoxyribonuclease-3
MRLTSWNVGMSLARKLPALMALSPDLAVLPEVSILDIGQHHESCWVGNLPHKGLGALAFNGFQIRRHLSWDDRIEFVLPIEVTGPINFLLIAVWAMHNRAVQRIQERPNRWQVLQALEVYEPLIRSRPTVVAGDFNNALFWDRPGKASNHSLAVERLRSLGLVSAYHASRGVEQGREAHPTLYWMWHEDTGYHIDYVWLPEKWLPALKHVEVGDYPTWVAGHLSDHVPLSVELDDALIR